MIKINRGEAKDFIRDNSQIVLTSMANYLPQLVRTESDDPVALLKRMFKETQTHVLDEISFKSGSDDEITRKELDLFTQLVLSRVAVTLRKPISEPRKKIQDDGSIVAVDIPVDQIMVQWRQTTDGFVCLLHFLEGDSEIVQTWN